MWEVLVIITLLVLTAIVFVVWLCAKIIGWIVSAVFGIGRKHDDTAQLPQGWSACRHPGCRATNPAHARFCRRCGQATGSSQSAVPMRYVA